MKVPIMTSMSLGSTPCASHAPRPALPSAPMLCASSKYRYTCTGRCSYANRHYSSVFLTPLHKTHLMLHGYVPDEEEGAI